MVYKAGHLHKNPRSNYKIMLLVRIDGHNGGIHIGPLTRLDLDKTTSSPSIPIISTSR